MSNLVQFLFTGCLCLNLGGIAFATIFTRTWWLSSPFSPELEEQDPHFKRFQDPSLLFLSSFTPIARFSPFHCFLFSAKFRAISSAFPSLFWYLLSLHSTLKTALDCTETFHLSSSHPFVGQFSNFFYHFLLCTRLHIFQSIAAVFVCCLNFLNFLIFCTVFCLFMRFPPRTVSDFIHHICHLGLCRFCFNLKIFYVYFIDWNPFFL